MGWLDNISKAQNGKRVKPTEDEVNRIQRGLDALQLVAGYVKKSPLGKVPGSAGSALGLFDSYQNKRDVNPADVVGLFPFGVTQAMSEVIDQGAREKKYMKQFAEKAKKINPKIELKETAPIIMDTFQHGGKFLGTTNKGLNYNGAWGGPAQNGKNVKDVRRIGDEMILPPIKQLKHTIPRYIPTGGAPQVSDNSNDTIKTGTQDFVNWYSHPETLNKFQKNTRLDKRRLGDLVSYGTKIPTIQASTAYPLLGEESQAEFQGFDVAPKEQIVYEPGVSKEAFGHELPHAAGIDTVLGPALRRVLGDATKQATKNAARKIKNYMNIPEESYGNFHQFRLKLGLKPGEKIKDAKELKNRAESTGANIENFYQTYDDEKIVKAINTIASTNKIPSASYAKSGAIIEDNRGQWAHPGKITKINSNNITMKGVPYPVYGISNTGDKKLMKSGEDYVFEGESVTEYPLIAKNGKKLDQLTNFTNYNKPQKGSWLDKK